MFKQKIRGKSLLPFSLVLLLSIAACQETPDSATVNSSPDNSEPTAEVAEEPSVAEPEPTAEPTEDAPSAEVALALATDGVTVVNVETGSTTQIAFDSDITLAKDAITAILGEPKETVENSECPAGPLTVTTWPNGFAINAAEDKFVGWGVRPETEGAKLKTMAGVGIGSTASELKEAYNVSVSESSLGVEFNAGQLSGLLSANEPDAKIENLWAGTNCIFR